MKIYNGIPGAHGISKGTLIYLKKNYENTVKISIDEAFEKAKIKVKFLYDKAVETTGSENAKIFEAYLMLLEDISYISPITELIKAGREPDEAVELHTDKMVGVFNKHKSEYMRQRAYDIKFVGDLLTDCLKGNEHSYILPDIKNIILAAEELTPADTIQLDKTNIKGFVTEKGGATSHSVILAKSLGIPALVGVNELNSSLNGAECILDATNGKLVTFPDESTLLYYDSIINTEKELNEKFECVSNIQAKTSDGERIYVYANIGSFYELNQKNTANIDGVGLFRSEFLYSSTQIKPSLETQIISYKSVIDMLDTKPVTIRTLDIGGDKKLEYMNMPFEENPFLGNRGIRLCLINKEIFKEQIKAILISAKGRNVKILLPMITEAEEIEVAKQIIDEVANTLSDEYHNNLLIGIMIETPASAVNSEKLAKYCDFFSIGTNDLIQYVTACDRGNDYVSNLYSPYNPAVLKLIYYVIKSANENKIDISMCGDMASDEMFTALLLGFGLKKFSVPLPFVNKIKYTIMKLSLTECRQLASEVLNADKVSCVKNILNKFNKISKI